MTAYELFRKAGFNDGLAEALEGRDVSLERALCMSASELLDEYLLWNGIIGYTGSILAALDSARSAEAARRGAATTPSFYSRIGKRSAPPKPTRSVS